MVAYGTPYQMRTPFASRAGTVRAYPRSNWRTPKRHLTTTSATSHAHTYAHEHSIASNAHPSLRIDQKVCTYGEG